MLGLALAAGRSAGAQAVAPLTPEMKLVVSVTGTVRPPDASEPLGVFGAGIVISLRDDELFVVTARHVVAIEGAAEDSLCVRFATGADTSCFRARRVATPYPDRSLDLAVLSVPLAPGRRTPVDRAMLHGRLGAPDRLEFRHPLEMVGCPAGICWQPNAEPQLFEGLDVNELVFHTTSVNTGNSGGALFNRWGELVGMVITDGQTRARAIRIEVIMDRLRDMNVAAQLDAPAFPKGGYPMTVGASMLAIAPGSRAPSARLTIERQLTTSVSWHAGALRLAPANISLVAAVAGASLDLRRGRLTVSPFVEGGIGQVDAQHDAGGHFEASGSGTRYVPFWQPVEGSALGGGVGVAAQVVVLPRLIVEGTIGNWRFNTPELSPPLPRVVAGFGARWAPWR